VQVIFVSFETLEKPDNVDVFISAWRQSLQAWQKEVASHARIAVGQSEIVVHFSTCDTRNTKLYYQENSSF